MKTKKTLKEIDEELKEIRNQLNDYHIVAIEKGLKNDDNSELEEKGKILFKMLALTEEMSDFAKQKEEMDNWLKTLENNQEEKEKE